MESFYLVCEECMPVNDPGGVIAKVCNVGIFRAFGLLPLPARVKQTHIGSIVPIPCTDNLCLVNYRASGLGQQVYIGPTVPIPFVG